MSKHRFDHTVDHSDDTKPEGLPDRLQRIEVITGVERRRKWSLEEKVEIVAESFAEGAVVSEVARRHRISPQQLFGWRARPRELWFGWSGDWFGSDASSSTIIQTRCSET